MHDYPDLSGVLYIDGHVNIYYGSKTKMPKHHVSRLRLCMSGSTDYWVNDKTGQPFFVVNKVINGSMIKVIKDDIIPKLDKDVPNQPTAIEIAENKLISRYMIVFDRECYSPDFFYDLWQERISICTYKKNTTDKWADEEFYMYEEELPDGEVQKMELAERGVLLQNKSSNKKIWTREIRKKSKSGHQTSIITTNFILSIIQIGFYIFSRWCQENFFKYMMENFGIDTLVSYLHEKISDTTILINPEYRQLDNKQRSITGMLNRHKTKFATLELKDTSIDEEKMRKYIKKKSELKEEIEVLEKEIEEIKQSKSSVNRKITFKELPESEKFTNVINDRKHFLDTIKMISYRAETSMANITKKQMSHPNEVRTFLKQVYKSDVNINPDYANNILYVNIHPMTYWKDDKILEYLCNELNKTETVFPSTNLKIFYKWVSN